MDEPTRQTPPDESAVETIIFALAAREDGPRTIAPEEAARALATGDSWQGLLPLVRRTAVRLAREERLVLYRKGKPVSPDDLRGVWRFGAPLPPAA